MVLGTEKWGRGERRKWNIQKGINWLKDRRGDTERKIDRGKQMWCVYPWIEERRKDMLALKIARHDGTE